MDIEKEIKKLVETGKVYYGLDQARKSVKRKNAKGFIVAMNCPDQEFLEKDNIEGIPIIKFNGKSSELGSICGKVFDISIITIIDPGESMILK